MYKCLPSVFLSGDEEWSTGKGTGETHGSPWQPMTTHGSPWEPTHALSERSATFLALISSQPHENPWKPMRNFEIHGNQWKTVKAHAARWAKETAWCIGYHGSTWKPVETRGNRWLPPALHHPSKHVRFHNIIDGLVLRAKSTHFKKQATLKQCVLCFKIVTPSCEPSVHARQMKYSKTRRNNEVKAKQTKKLCLWQKKVRNSKYQQKSNNRTVSNNRSFRGFWLGSINGIFLF